MLGGLVLTGAAFANLVFVSVWAQTVLGLGPVKAGLVLTPLAGVSFVVAGAGGRLLHGVPARYSIGAGLLLVGIGTLLDMLVVPSSGWTALLAGLVVTGVGVGLASPVLASAALTTAPPERAGMANGAMNTFRQLGFAVGVPVFGTALASQARDSLRGSGQFDDPAAAGALSGGGAPELLTRVPAAARDAADHALRTAFTAGLDRIFLVCGIAGLLAGAAVLTLVRPALTGPGPTSTLDGDTPASDGVAPAGLPTPTRGDGGPVPTGANTQPAPRRSRRENARRHEHRRLGAGGEVAVTQLEDVVGHGTDGAPVMTDEHDGQPVRADETADELAERVGRHRVQGGGHLVADQHIRVGRQGAGKREPLPLAAREQPRSPGRERRIKPELGQQPGHRGPAVPARAGVVGGQPVGVRHAGADGTARVQRGVRVLEHIADASTLPRWTSHRRGPQRYPVQLDAARVPGVQTQHRPGQARLPGPRRADHPDTFAAPDRQINPPQHLDPMPPASRRHPQPRDT